MPPLLMTTLLSLVLTLVAPDTSLTLPHLSKVSRIAPVSIDLNQR
jgi:hypothetical protein